MVDKEFCMSSYLVYRYVEDENVSFYPNLSHKNFKPLCNEDRIKVSTAEDIDKNIQVQIDANKHKKLGILLSGGIDSGILASYLKGCDAYTFRFQEKDTNPSQRLLFSNEISRAQYYADKNDLNLHYVDINWRTIEKYLDIVIDHKGAPVHSIEPQIYQAAIQAKNDDIELMIIGESADLIFGGMDKLLSQDWNYTDFIDRYTFTDPEKVLNNPKNVNYLFEKFKQANKIKLLDFMDYVFSIESSGSYWNVFNVTNLNYLDPYAILTMSESLDLERVRNGEPKYLIRDLFKIKYPDMVIPDKIPMPRPVNSWFKNWGGPKRAEFKTNLNMNEFTGDQKWQIYCLEYFLNHFDNKFNQ